MGNRDKYRYLELRGMQKVHTTAEPIPLLKQCHQLTAGHRKSKNQSMSDTSSTFKRQSFIHSSKETKTQNVLGKSIFLRAPIFLNYYVKPWFLLWALHLLHFNNMHFDKATPNKSTPCFTTMSYFS